MRYSSFITFFVVRTDGFGPHNPHIHPQDKGMTYPLVVILVGGPDWPVSVMAGVLKQNVFKMLLGTTPIILPIGL